MQRRRPRKPPADPAPWLRRAIRCGLGCSLLSVATACAFSYVDSDGTRHIFGLVDMEIRPGDASEALAGDVVDVTSVGIAYHSAPEHTSVTLGYSRNVTAALRDNVVVLGNPSTALEADSSERTGLGKDNE